MDDSTPYAIPLAPEHPVAPARIVHELAIDELPVGITRLFVELVGDGLAVGVRVPVIVARGKQPGPVFGITAGVHGNELNGIPVIHELFRRIDVEHVRGTIVGVVAVNVPGLHRNQRGFIDGTDLNRIMPGSAHGTEAQVYAYRVVHRILKDFTHLVDLHTASFGRINSLYVRADMEDPRTAAMAYLQGAQIIVHNAASDRTVRGAAMSMGIPSVTVEIGNPQRWQRSFTRSAVAGLTAALQWAGVTQGPPPEDPMTGPEAPIVCDSSSWMFTDRGGLLDVFPQLLDRVKEGQRIATVTNAFGDPIREYRATGDAVIVGKSTNPVGFTGARIVHLGHEAAPGRFVEAAQCVAQTSAR